MSDLRYQIKEFTDDFLLEQYYRKRNEYTTESIAILEEEIQKRGITMSEADYEEQHKDEHYTIEDFQRFPHGFNYTDLLIAVAILKDSDIPHAVENMESSDTLPIEAEAEKYFQIRIPNALMEKALELIDNQFISENGVYKVKLDSLKDKLKAFSLAGLHLTDEEITEEVEMDFTPEAIDVTLKYVNKLIDNADDIEREKGIMIFYYDNLGCCSDTLLADGNRYTKEDLLTVIEVLQIFCEEPGYPDFLDEIGVKLTEVFIR